MYLPSVKKFIEEKKGGPYRSVRHGRNPFLATNSGRTEDDQLGGLGGVWGGGGGGFDTWGRSESGMKRKETKNSNTTAPPSSWNRTSGTEESTSQRCPAGKEKFCHGTEGRRREVK